MKKLLTTLFVLFFLILISCADDDTPELIPEPVNPPPSVVDTYQGIMKARDASSYLDFNNMPVETIFDTSYAHEVVVEVEEDSIFFKGFYENQIIELRYNTNGEYDKTTGPKDIFNIQFKTNDTLIIYTSVYGGISNQEYISYSRRYTGVKQ